MNSINQIANGELTSNVTPAKNAISKSSGDFTKMLESMVSKVNETQLNGEQAIKDLHSGKAQHLHEVMIAVEEADISLRMLVQMRNRALTAYEEIMRMQL